MDSLVSSEDINFYKQSLLEAENNIENENKTKKALKDIIGLSFEKHRERIWKYFGFDVSLY